MRARLSAADLGRAGVIVVIWGSNFVVMKMGLREMGPMLLGALRFAVASLPLLLFIRRPALPWRFIAAYGLAQGLGQFGCVFLALSLGLPAGIASIILQTQAFFTVILAGAFLGERTRATQWIGLLISACGLALIATSARTGSGHIPIGGFLLCLAGAAMWACSNIVARLAQRHNPDFDATSLVVWGSLAPIVPFLMLAVWQDGLPSTLASMQSMTWKGATSVVYLALVATVLAYSMWANLLKRYSAGTVAPFSLLVPVIGLFAAWIVLDERLSLGEWIGVAIAGAGLLVNSFGDKAIGIWPLRSLRRVVP